MNLCLDSAADHARKARQPAGQARTKAERIAAFFKIESFHFEQLNMQGSILTGIIVLHLCCQTMSYLSTSVRYGFIRVVVASAASSALRPAAIRTAQFGDFYIHLRMKWEIAYHYVRQEQAPGASPCCASAAASAFTPRRSIFPVPSMGSASTWKNWFARGFHSAGRSHCGSFSSTGASFS